MSADEIRAEAVRETRRYIDRIHKRGLVPLGTVLADMEAAACRMDRGMTARGNTRIGSDGPCSSRDPITGRRCWHAGGHGGQHEIGEPDGPIVWDDQKRGDGS